MPLEKVLILHLHPLVTVPHACLLVARLVCSSTYSMKQGVKIANIRKYFLISPAQVLQTSRTDSMLRSLSVSRTNLLNGV